MISSFQSSAAIPAGIDGVVVLPPSRSGPNAALPTELKAMAASSVSSGLVRLSVTSGMTGAAACSRMPQALSAAFRRSMSDEGSASAAWIAGNACSPSDLTRLGCVFVARVLTVEIVEPPSWRGG